MFTRFTRQRMMAIALTCLLFISLVLAACGGATESASEESTTSSETEEVTESAAENEEQAQESEEAASAEESEAPSEEATTEDSEAASEEPAVAEETETTDDENSTAPEQELTSSGVAACRTVTPDNDPIAAVLQPNELIAAISDSDWTKGPADAAIIVIEYGDFQ